MVLVGHTALPPGLSSTSDPESFLLCSSRYWFRPKPADPRLVKPVVPMFQSWKGQEREWGALSDPNYYSNQKDGYLVLLQPS